MKATARNALRHWLLAAAPILAACALPVAAQENYPTRPVRIIVQYQAGGSTDTMARLLADKLAPRLGQPVVVENRSGAGGIIGTDYVAKSPADGYTLLMTVPDPVMANIVLYRKLPYGTRTLHLPYKGEGPMAVDLIAGQIQMTVGSVTTLAPYIAAGKFRALAVVGPTRAKALPDVPTFAEQGYKDAYQAFLPISLKLTRDTGVTLD